MRCKVVVPLEEKASLKILTAPKDEMSRIPTIGSFKFPNRFLQSLIK